MWCCLRLCRRRCWIIDLDAAGDDGLRISEGGHVRILREREQAIHALSRGGVHVLDVEPAKLTAPLINQFIEIRRSALI